jgi:hypothetical protein
MRIAVVGTVVAIGLVMASLTWAIGPDGGISSRGGVSPVVGSSRLETVVTSLGDQVQQVLLVDPEQRVMTVYHITKTGEIVLKSVRYFHWDQRIEQFNSPNPSPREIRSQVETH